MHSTRKRGKDRKELVEEFEIAYESKGLDLDVYECCFEYLDDYTPEYLTPSEVQHAYEYVNRQISFRHKQYLKIVASYIRPTCIYVANEKSLLLSTLVISMHRYLRQILTDLEQDRKMEEHDDLLHIKLTPERIVQYLNIVCSPVKLRIEDGYIIGLKQK